MPSSVDAPPRATSASASAGAGSSPQRVDVVAVTRSDDLLEQIGHLLDGESAVRPVDSVEAAAGQFAANRAHLVLLDARDCAEVGTDVERLLTRNDGCVVVVFAPAEQTSGIAGAIKGSAAFAVLPIPIEAGQTAAVLDGAREEALSRLTIMASQCHKPAPDPPVPPLAARPEPRPEPVHAPEATRIPPTDRGDPIVTDDVVKRRPPPVLLVGGVVAVLLAITIGWYVASRPEQTSRPALQPVATEAARQSPDPAVQQQAAKPPPVDGSVDELLDLARAAFRDRRYTDPAADSALTFFRSVLAQDPDNGEAIEGVARIAAVLDERLQAALSERRTEDAAVILGHLRLAKPDDAGLAALEAEVTESQLAAAVEGGALDRANQLLRNAEAARKLATDRVQYWRERISGQQLDARARQLVQLIYARIDEGRLVEPENDSAKFHLAQLRALSEDPARRAAPTRRLGQAYLQRAQDATAQRQPAEAARWLAEARGLGVRESVITAATEASAQAAPASPAATPESERLARLVQTRIAEGKPLEPREDSALHHIEGLRSIDQSGAATAQVRTAELKRTRYVAPVYPRAALEDNVSGEVRVRITVDAEGKVADTVILESTPAGVFDGAALAAVRRWRFKPAEVDGRPVESSSIQSLLFRPGDGT
jgi:TonB family protein